MVWLPGIAKQYSLVWFHATLYGVGMSIPRPQTRTDRLSRDDWIDAAQAMLVESGIDAVQITVLARRLGVTRGSFYWHFDSRESLLAAITDRWRNQNTNVMLDAVAGVKTLDEGILSLFSVWTDHTRFDPDLDQAVRDWARHDQTLWARVRAEDNSRISAVAEFFERFGYEKTEAFIRARVICLTQMSYYALRMEQDESMTQRLSYLEAYFRCFTGRDLLPDTADRYRGILLREAAAE
ncbi:MAG: TetR/AcrR family transcriptional regulator [Pseudomonadota bacterium]